MKSRKHVGNLLKIGRLNSRLSQKEVTDYMGYTEAQFCSNWERHLSSPPDNRLHELCFLFEIKKKDMRMAVLADREADLRNMGL